MSDTLDCVVSYDRDSRCVVMEWRPFTSGERFRRANEAVLAALRAHGASRLLGEIEALSLPPPIEQAWLADDWIPRAAQAGLRHVALVTPAFQFEHAPILLIGENLPKGLDLKYFDEMAAGRAWLASRPDAP